jgi:hypothetical protein
MTTSSGGDGSCPAWCTLPPEHRDGPDPDACYLMVGRVVLPPTDDDAEVSVQVEAWQHPGAPPVICVADEAGNERVPALPPAEALAISNAIATAAAAILTNTAPMRVNPDDDSAGGLRPIPGSGSLAMWRLSS